MAQGQRNGNSTKPLATLSPEVWAAACASAGYTVDDSGNAVIGISGEKGDGYLATIPCPVDMDPENLARAALQYALRVGQAGLKASKSPDRDVATKAAQSAVNGGYKPSRDRSVDIVEREAEREFELHVRARVKETDPNASEDDIAATLKKMAESEGGKAWIADKKAEVLARGTYAVSRKAGSKGEAIAITL
jgi:hypothetical protein